MRKRIPVRLKREPLLEAVWEVRFTSAKRSVVELLPGLIYKALGSNYPNAVRLPAADIPSVVVEQDPSLRFVPKIRLEGNNHAVQIGDHVVQWIGGIHTPDSFGQEAGISARSCHCFRNEAAYKR